MDEHLDEHGFKNINVLMREWDDTIMQLPTVESDPHILISKVRKHYLEYVIQLLSVNYENSQKLLGKNIYLPSAIWRCANTIEMDAARASMVVDLYRKNLTGMIKELKTDTKKGKLNKMLLKCLQTPPANEKTIQVTIDKIPNDFNCSCNGKNGTNKKRRKLSSPKRTDIPKDKTDTHNNNNVFNETANTEVDQVTEHGMSVLFSSRINDTETNKSQCIKYINDSSKVKVLNTESDQSSKQVTYPRISVESQESEDQVMLQLEQLFRADSNELEDDLFEGTLCEALDTSTWDVVQENKSLESTLETSNAIQDSTINEQAAKIQSLNERLTMLESSGILNSNPTNNTCDQKNINEPSKSKKPPQKWLCEHYFQKLYLFERMDDIRENNRKKHSRIKHKFIEIFGEDSDSEDNVMSPLDETTEFVFSCKERIAPWIVKMLTPCYVKGRIRGKALFKSLAKHLIRLIYQCSKYPSEFEVNSFVSDFLRSHKMIRCEADYKEFKIDNI